VNLVEASAKNRMALMKMTVPTSSCDQRTNQDVTSGRIVVEALIKVSSDSSRKRWWCRRLY